MTAPRTRLVTPAAARAEIAQYSPLADTDLGVAYCLTPAGWVWLPVVRVDDLPLHEDHTVDVSVVLGAPDDLWWLIELRLHDGPRPGITYRWRLAGRQAWWALRAVGVGFGLTAGERETHLIPWTTLAPTGWAPMARMFAVVAALVAGGGGA